MIDSAIVLNFSPEMENLVRKSAIICVMSPSEKGEIYRCFGGCPVGCGRACVMPFRFSIPELVVRDCGAWKVRELVLTMPCLLRPSPFHVCELVRECG